MNKEKTLKRITVALLLFICGILFAGADNNRADAAVKWNTSKKITVKKGKVTYYAYLSANKKQSWVYKVKIPSGKKVTLSFPAKVHSAKLTTIGSPDSIRPVPDSERQDAVYNILGSSGEPWHGLAGDDVPEVREVIIPDTVKTIGSAAFCAFTGMKKLSLSKNITQLSSYTFYMCEGLKEVHLGKKIRKISDTAFEQCTSLVSYSVDKSNKNMKSKNGLILSKNGRNILAAPFGIRKVRIPAGVKTIEKEMFKSSKIREVWIPASLKTIGSGAFDRTHLRKWHIDSKNKYFGKKNGCVYGKKSGKLVFMCYSDKKLQIPSQVTVVDNTFSVQKEDGLCTYQIVFPKTLKKISVDWKKSISGILAGTLYDLKIYFTASKVPQVTNANKHGFPEDLVNSAMIFAPKKYVSVYNAWVKKYDPNASVQEY